jgi:DNA topoisomerase-1
MTDLLIVESPAKAKTISKYLGSDFQVLASVGHIKDLPRKTLGVDIKQDFTPTYVTIDGKEKTLKELTKAAKGKNTIFLGPDPDREGEAIAWHIAESLGRNKYNFKRVLFDELTPKAIKAAIAEPVEISENRFESQQTRRILDRLMGYLISPVLWGKLKRGLSAGRVQSVALRLVVERERKIFAFVPEEYWTLAAIFKKDEEEFEAALVKKNGKKIELKTGQETEAIVKALTNADFTISSISTKEKKKNALPPFTTSTLQQAAFTRFSYTPTRTMRLAQQLYEGLELPEGSVGLISYMRTDSVRVSDEAAANAAALIKERYGPDHLPKSRNFYRNKKGAQDAHEAIRPTSVERTPESIKHHLASDLYNLYSLIWNRFVASQMAPAVYLQTAVEMDSGEYGFRANGSILKFKGYLAAYAAQKDEDEKNLLPALSQGEILKPTKLNPTQHFTQPPARFNDATLVKELESNGIGRPSTYATIISTLRDKEYVEGQKGQLRPTEMGFVVNDLLVANFPKLLDVDFTAGLEENLDQIEEGQAERLAILTKLYKPLAEYIELAKDNMINVKIAGVPVDIPCPKCKAEHSMFIRYGRNGFYLACTNCNATCDFSRDERGMPVPTPEPKMDQPLFCELCGKPMVMKKSRFGHFLACSGYPECKNTKPIQMGLGETAATVEPPPIPEGISMTCPNCGSPMGMKRSHKGSWFLGCTNYPKCRTTKPVPTEFKCPMPGCDGYISERSSKRGSFYGCSNYPECKFISKGTPENDPCPECNFPYRFSVQTRKNAGSYLKCPNPNCPTNEAKPASVRKSNKDSAAETKPAKEKKPPSPSKAKQPRAASKEIKPKPAEKAPKTTKKRTASRKNTADATEKL